MVIFLFLLLFAVGIGSLFYFWNRFHKFYFVQKIAKEHKKFSWLVAAIPVLLLVLLFFVKTVIATIICLHLLVFWLLCDFISWLMKRTELWELITKWSLVADFLNWFRKKTEASSKKYYYPGIFAILITTVYLCIGWYYGHHVFETHYTVESKKELGVDNLRIVQISDSHLGCTFDGDGFAKYMKRVQKTKPDIVVVTGDFVDDDSEKKEMIKVCKALGELKTTYGVYFVYGNHDKGYFHSRDFSAEELDKELEKNDVTVLKDEMVDLNEHISIIGRKDRSEEKREKISDLMEVMEKENRYLIVLDHQPHDFAAEAEAGCDLVLCGHTHGGQMFPVGITGELSGENDKTYGLEKRKDTTFIVNSGISDWAIPFKTAAIAEYGVIDVKPSKEVKEDETVSLNLIHVMSSYMGWQNGWFADELKDKLGVKLYISPLFGGEQEDYLENPDNGVGADLAVLSENQFYEMINKGKLYPWEKNDLLKKEGKYLSEHMKDAVAYGKEKTKEATNGASDALYGICPGIAGSKEDHNDFYMTWDVRYDLYKNLGYPKVKDLSDYQKLLEKMQKICPKDENGKKAYAVSMWSDWDEDMLMYVKATVSAYYGYDAAGLGFYDVNAEDGNYFHEVLEKNGPYFEMLRYYHQLYGKGLLDPDSKKLKYDKVIKKVQNGGVLSSLFNHSGSGEYSQISEPYDAADKEDRLKKAHLEAGKLMAPVPPENATPAVYGYSTKGSGYGYVCISADTRYPELCMRLLNWLSTPEGYLISRYGPKGVTWDYDADGNTYFTELGKKCNTGDARTKLGNGYEGTFQDGCDMTLLSMWNQYAENPDSNGESFHSERWKSNMVKGSSEIEKDWQEHTKAGNAYEYFENGKNGDGTKKYVVIPDSGVPEEEKSEELKETWEDVGDVIKEHSWKAIYAKSEKEFKKALVTMRKKAEESGYEACIKWSREQAAKRYVADQSR